MVGRTRLCGPNQESTDRVPLIEGVEQAPHLIAVPDITALEFWERNMSVIDVV